MKRNRGLPRRGLPRFYIIFLIEACLVIALQFILIPEILARQYSSTSILSSTKQAFTVGEDDFERVKELFNRGLYLLASDEWTRFIQKYPESEFLVRATFYLAECLYCQEKYEQASEKYQHLLQIHLDSELISNVLTRLTQVLTKLNRPEEEIIATYQRIIDSHPESPAVPEALYRLGSYSFEKQDYPKAYEYFYQISKNHQQGKPSQSPYLTMSLYFQGLSLYHCGYFKEATLPFSRFISATSTVTDTELQAESQYYLADCWYQEKNWDNALIEATKFINVYPQHQLFPEALFIKAFCLSSQGCFEEAVLDFSTIIEKYPPSSKRLASLRLASLYYSGEILLEQLKDYQKAKEAFKRLITGFPENEFTAHAQYNLGLCELSLAHLDEAKSCFEGVIKNFKEPDLKSHAYFQLGEIYKRQTEFQKVIVTYENMFKDCPENPLIPRILYELVLAYIKTDDFVGAKAICYRMMAGYLTSTWTPLALYESGNKFFVKKDYLSAADVYNHFLKNYPIHPLSQDVCYQLGLAYGQLQQYEKARGCFLQLQKQYSPKDLSNLLHRIRYGIGWSYYLEGRYKDAVEEFRNFLSMPSNKDQTLIPEVLYKTGNCLFNLKEYQQAIDTYLKLIIDYPKSRLIDACLYQLAQSYYKQGKFGVSQQYFLKLIKGYPESKYLPKSIYWLGWTYYSQGKYEDALTIYQQVIDKFPSLALANEAQYQVGTCLYNLKKFKEAGDAYQKVIKNLAASSGIKKDALYQLGNCLFQQKKYTEAIAVYRNFIQTNPEEKELCAELRYRIGEIYYNQGEIKKAIEEYNLFIDEYPKSAQIDDVLYWLGRCFIKDNDKTFAIMTFRALVKQYPDSEWTADSQFRIGVCLYEEGEYKEASVEFESLIKNFVSRKDLVTEARDYIERCKKRK
ncbi:MAG: tetratricopeptide repeat protein [bacterium]|nr:tetratricopeptide repeat protein [bacterium]